MKRFSILLLFAAFLTVSVNSIAQNPNIKQISNTNENQPYKIAFNNLKLGKADYSKMILNAWKAYDSNKLDDISMIIADTITSLLPDGTLIKGKDNFLNAMKTYRGSFTSVVSTVDACTTLKSASAPDDEITVIWGTETSTKKDGTTQKMGLHEVWFFNKDGMVSRFFQYAVPMLEKK